MMEKFEREKSQLDWTGTCPSIALPSAKETVLYLMLILHRTPKL